MSFYTPPNNSFHAIHKVPSGNSPYVTAKHVQLIDKDPSKAISLFWAAINAGDRVDSALKDMAIVMKQLGRSDEAIEAIKSFRHLCSRESQDSLDNLLIDIYKHAGRTEEEIEILKLKVKQVEEGYAYGGKSVKRANSYGKKVQMPVEKEYSRLLGNLAWAYMKKKDYKSAEEYYRKALSIDSNTNKQCNLATCLIHMNRLAEAKLLLQAVRVSFSGHVEDSQAKSYERASEMLSKFESNSGINHVKWGEHGNGVPYERRANFDWRTNRSQFGMDRGATDYARKRAHDASPYTQPRQRPWSFNSASNRSMASAESGTEGFRQKLLFVSSNGADNPSDYRKCGKSWADMVDEKVENVGMTGYDYSGSNDENVDSNMISETPRSSLEDVEKVNQRMKLLDLESGYCTQPKKIKSQIVRRSLCFDQNQKPVEEALVFEGMSSTESDTFFSSESCMNLTRRLQVFEDITHTDNGRVKMARN